MWKDAKYLLAYALPIGGFWGLFQQGVWSPGSFYIAFVIIPVIELFSKGTPENLSEGEELEKARSPFFDWLLYLNLPHLVWRDSLFFLCDAKPVPFQRRNHRLRVEYRHHDWFNGH